MAKLAPVTMVSGLRPVINPRARMALVDAVLAEHEPRSCATVVLRWLERYAGLAVSLCAVVDGEGANLVGLSGVGLSPADVDQFRVDLADRSHPLVVALLGFEPVDFGASSGVPQSPFGRSAFQAVQLAEPPGRGELGPGLLLVGGTEMADDVRWAAQMLGLRLISLWYGRAQADERRHRQERSSLLSIINAVTDPILLTDADGRILIANSAAEKLLSTEEAMSVGRRRAVALNNMLFSASLFTTGQLGKPGRHELLLVDPQEGQDLLFELMSSPSKLRRGETGNVAVLRNVTDLRRASEELEENYRRLRAAEALTRAERDRLDLILNSVVDPVLVTDAAGAIVLMNPPAERLFTMVLAGGDEEGRVRANDAVFSSFVSNLYTGQSLRWRGELNLLDPQSGAGVPVEAFSGKVLSRAAEETWTVTILHDLTEAAEKAKLYERIQRHAEELRERVKEATGELAEQNELLRRQAYEVERASAMKSQFLANVSHELRTPLNAIIGYAHLLIDGVAGDLSRSQNDKLVRIDSNARHLLSIINDLLDIARIEAGKMPIHYESLELPELIDEVMAEVDPLIPVGRLTVVRHLIAGTAGLLSDRKKVKQILLNLLSNALKFTPQGEITITVDNASEDLVKIAVADTGIGISEENQRGIFEAFAQSDSSYARRAGGTGLGLSICRRLATSLGGDIALESRLGVGSTFTLLLPRRTRRER
jgi:signal transduction histidine kinase/PAS domain-containing protein